MAETNDQKSGHETPDVSHIHTAGVGHEESDVEVGGVAWFTAGLALLMIVTGVLMWGMFRFFNRTEHGKEPPPTSLTREKKPESGNPELMFPEPRLQQHPALELQQYRDEENEKRKTYAWVDESAGVVRIPIEDAKKKLLKQGLPFRQAPPGTEAPRQSVTANPESKNPTSPRAGSAGH